MTKKIILILSLCVCILGGCSATSVDVAQVSGVVTLDGEPVANARVMFYPVAGGPRSSNATTNEKGEFKASTFGVYDGALIGHHAVTVSKVDEAAFPKIDPNEGYSGKAYEQMMSPSALKKNAKPKMILPEKYSKKETSGIEVDVVKGEKNNFPLNLVSK